ncbi:ABC transporter permease [Actinomycetaceae bacterium TAE3-ERU4]|nr:ABC transporter permease [Actinomycetaceae bacterium TAE3-ERU4]
MSNVKIEPTEPESRDLTPETLPADADVPTKRTKIWKLYLRRFMRNRMAALGLVIIISLVLFAIVGPYMTPWKYDDPDFLALGEPPSANHWFGTQAAGNDLFAQCAHAVGRSLIIGFTVSISTTIIAAIVGTATAYFGALGPAGRLMEKIMLNIINFLLIMPAFLIIALLIKGNGGTWQLLILVLILFGWMGASRVIWSLSMSIREREFVTAARYMGVSSIKILWRHMIPNIGSLLIIQMSLGVQATIMAETSYSFLGIGIQEPDVSLGSLLSSSTGALYSSPWLFWFPASILTLITLAAAFIADGLRDALDPNSAAGGRA